MNKIFCNVREAADALNIGRSKAYELINGGALETAKIGQRRVVRIESVTAYADSLKRAA
jgi:excisionase family DNA binding protein